MDRSEQEPGYIPVETLREAYIENALGPRGVLNDVALAATEPIDRFETGQQIELAADDAADVILPPRRPGEPAIERWRLVEESKAIIKESVAARESKVYALAEQLDMRLETSLPDREIGRIDGDKAVWVAEGGANRTGKVRTALVTEAMRKVYGESTDLSEYTVYQLGSHRPIPIEKNDAANPEHGVAQSLAPDYVTSKTTDLTEFKLNGAIALQSGYSIIKVEDLPDGVAEAYELTQPGMPRIVAVRPAVNPGEGYGTLTDGFNAIAAMHEDRLNGRQLVIGTNGQYRPKDELQASRWATLNEVDMMPPVAIGDEPGFQVMHNGKIIETGQRPPAAYINEVVVLRRLLRQAD